jgi:hypothetical protein
MRKYVLAALAIISTFLFMGQMPDESTPEKTIKLYYDAINHQDRNELTLSYHSDFSNYYFPQTETTCIYKYKIVSKTAAGKKTAYKKSKKRRMKKMVVQAKDVKIVTQTDSKCSDDNQDSGKYIYWLRKYNDYWKIYKINYEGD